IQVTDEPAATLPAQGAVPNSWQPRTAPFNLKDVAYTHFRIARANGLVNYACVIDPQAPSLTIWKTVDGGLHWTKAAPLHAVIKNNEGCYPVVDDGDPQRVYVYIDNDTLVYSNSGGAQWTAIPQGTRIEYVMTVHGVTYAQVKGLVPSFPGFTFAGIARSRD